MRCQYVEIPQVEQTAAVIGSRPHWLWGFEHGVNEHHVAIGNELVFTKEALGPIGLLGMDLVRLGLERGRTAEHALEVITDLIERYGQGGSGQPDVDWPYSNGFIIADPQAAWLLETSGRHWAARQVQDVGNASNRLSIGRDWEHAGADATCFAIDRGWSAREARLDFAGAYADPNAPATIAGPRRARAAALLVGRRGELSEGIFRTILRDHYDDGVVPGTRGSDDPHFFSLCMHADPLDNTTASMVTSLPADPAEVRTVWISLGSPCVGTFLPLYREGHVPPELARGGTEPSADSPWWQMRALLSAVERRFEDAAPVARARWDVVEQGFTTSALEHERRATALGRQGRCDEQSSLLTAFMRDALDQYLETLRVLGNEFDVHDAP